MDEGIKMAKDKREYHGDVIYEVWRRGGNPDAVEYDRVEDHYYAGDEAPSAAQNEIRRQREWKRRQVEESAWEYDVFDLEQE